jgi:hypothetical protein
MHLKDRPPLPTLNWTKKTGPLESILIKTAHSGTSQLKMKMTKNPDTKMSKNLLTRKKDRRWSTYCRKHSGSLEIFSLVVDKNLVLVRIKILLKLQTIF